MQKFSSGAASPVRPGAGDGDIAAQAKHYTTNALEEIGVLLKQSEDEKIRLACAKYLLELAWGRPRAMKPVSDENADVDQDLYKKITDMIDSARVVRLQQANLLVLEDSSDMRRT